jgi:gentisate 1,2-dioxygenase
MTTYASKDFARVAARLVAAVPERLAHPDVLDAAEDPAFSAARKHPVTLVDLPSKTLSVTIGGLDPHGATNRHRHNYETIIVVLKGHGRSVIEDRVVPWKAGDAIYVPVWAWHHHENLSDEFCQYVACENAPLLQNLGGIALREEEEKSCN